MAVARIGDRYLDLIVATFDQFPDPAFIYDKASTVLAVNRAGQNLLGTSSQCVAGRMCSEVFHCRTCDRGCRVQAGLRGRQGTAERTVRIRAGGGREHLAFVKSSQLTDDTGEVQGVLAILTFVVETPLYQGPAIVAESYGMCKVLEFARRVASSEAATILVEGESGTGKELVARLLHDDSRRSAHPFVAINCAAIPETLLESELFGYEKGAFTDARSSKKGVFELADKGTLFLDEIAELPIALQAKLLRVLDDRSFRRLGGVRDIQLDVRIVTATNRDLRLAVTEGAFRQDLYYRVNVIQLTIPPLRERRDDILPLAHFFIDQFNRKFKRSIEALPTESARLLVAYDWPGNVRELRNLMERSVVLGETDSISPESLPHYVQNPPSSASKAGQSWLDHGLSLDESEHRLIASAMEKAEGNQTKAAKLLQISRDTLRYRLKNDNRGSRAVVA